ncbi:MAG: hypothetical protein QME49_10165, partial [bacterium]|nr:hypothetical protein [bacterium]
MYNLILVPSLFCPASCKYCFGPNQDTGNVPHKGGSPSGGGSPSAGWSPSAMCENRSMDACTVDYALDFALRLMEEQG